MILDAVRESGGLAVAVDEGRISSWMGQSIRAEGVAICPETAACIGALEQLTATGWVKPDEEVVVFNTGAAQKYLEAIEQPLPSIDLNRPLDWEAIDAGTP